MQFISIIVTIWHREVLRYSRDRTRIFLTIFQPLMFLFIFGSGLRHAFASGNLGIDFIQFMYPGILAVSIMGVSFYSTISTIWDREFGFLKEILVAPVSRTAIIIGKASGAVTIALSQALVLLLIAPLLNIKIYFIMIPELIMFMMLLSFCIAGMGLLMATLLRTIENFGVLMNIIVFPMFFLSGAFFPLHSIPLWMTIFSRINPLTYAVDAFRHIILSPQISTDIAKNIFLNPMYINAIYLFIFSILMVLSASIMFNKKG
ncbi:MAG: ABC transporter permease [Candidatus Firestonebacteria bacterium]|nr:ABC transporter permease [Candidatus Firestonebacteria bacterium]